MTYFLFFLCAFLPLSILIAMIAQKIQAYSYAKFKAEGVWATRDDVIVDTVTWIVNQFRTKPSLFPLTVALVVSASISTAAILSY